MYIVNDNDGVDDNSGEARRIYLGDVSEIDLGPGVR